MTSGFAYRTGIVVLVLATAATILYHMGILIPTECLYPCAFHRLTGLYCPGCGGTRAIEALLRGDFLSCLFYHPFVFYCFILYLLFMVSHTLEYLCTYGKKPLPHLPTIKGLTLRLTYLYIGIFILLIQWICKNLSLL